MFRQLLRDSATYGVSNVLSRGVAILLVPLYTRVLSTADYGVIDLLGAATVLVNLTIALEISQGLVRYFADSPSAEDRKAYASTALWFTVAVYSAFVILSLGLSGVIDQVLLNGSGQIEVIRLAIVSVWVSGVFSLVQNQLRWELRAVDYAAVSLIFTAVSVAASVILVLVFQIGVLGVVGGQLLGHCVGLLAGLIATRKSFRRQLDTQKLAAMLRFSLPMVPSSVGVFVSVYVDRIVVGQVMTLGDVGLFGIGYRVASLVTLLMVGFQGALTPLVYARYREPETPQEIARIFRLFSAGALFLCLALGTLAPELLRLATVPDFYEGALVVPLLAPALLLSSMYIFAPGLGIAKKTSWFAAINLVAAGINVTLNLLLVPTFGIVGAATATLVTASASFAAYMVISQRLYRVPHEWRRLGLATVVTIALGGLTFVLPATDLSTTALKLIALGVAVMSYITLGLVDVSAIRKALRARLPL